MIHAVFSIYNSFSAILKHLLGGFNGKKVSWRKLMLTALHAAKAKLSAYYGETDAVHGNLFAIGTILASHTSFNVLQIRAGDLNYARSIVNA
jgi:hypothetical protein